MTFGSARGASAAIDMHGTLCEDLPLAEIQALRSEVRAHFDQLVSAQKKSELVAIDLAELLCVRLEALLGSATHMPPAHRASVVGAARYFISTNDAVPDTAACVGLDDDVLVFNHVASALGRHDLLIDD